MARSLLAALLFAALPAAAEPVTGGGGGDACSASASMANRVLKVDVHQDDVILMMEELPYHHCEVVRMPDAAVPTGEAIHYYGSADRLAALVTEGPTGSMGVELRIVNWQAPGESLVAHLGSFTRAQTEAPIRVPDATMYDVNARASRLLGTVVVTPCVRGAGCELSCPSAR